MFAFDNELTVDELECHNSDCPCNDDGVCLDGDCQNDNDICIDRIE